MNMTPLRSHNYEFVTYSSSYQPRRDNLQVAERTPIVNERNIPPGMRDGRQQANVMWGYAE